MYAVYACKLWQYKLSILQIEGRQDIEIIKAIYYIKLTVFEWYVCLW